MKRGDTIWCIMWKGEKVSFGIGDAVRQWQGCRGQAVTWLANTSFAPFNRFLLSKSRKGPTNSLTNLQLVPP